MDFNSTVKGHCRDHAGIPNSLQFHVAAVRRAFQLNNHELCFLVHSQQVDAPCAVIPFAEFLSQDVKVVPQDINLRSEQSLNVRAFSDAHINERLLWNGAKRRIRHLKQRHAILQLALGALLG